MVDKEYLEDMQSKMRIRTLQRNSPIEYKELKRLALIKRLNERKDKGE